MPSSPTGILRRYPLSRVLPTRVRRNYRGGLLLDRLEGRPDPCDSERPEDWIASTTAALNPGLPPENGEGLTRLELGDGTHTTLADLLASDPGYYLGAHAGVGLGFLAKLLDSAMRLHVQAHPTAAFAQTHLDSPHGKLETYYVLETRIQDQAYLRLGFQHSPGREGWRSIVEGQNLALMDRCFEPIPLKPGEVWIVPGGFPHAIGDGVLMVEIMEPSDLVVRCEFEREGLVVPPAGRFMGRGLDFCLDIFDYTTRSVAEIRRLCQLEPGVLARGDAWVHERLVGADRTSCFEVQRVSASVPLALENDGRACLVLQTKGTGVVSAEGETVQLRRGASAFLAAGARGVGFAPAGPGTEWLLCKPAPR